MPDLMLKHVNAEFLEVEYFRGLKLIYSKRAQVNNE